MNFDIKDVKSWANRKDVKIGAEGYFCHDINKLRNNENEYIKPVKSKLSAIRDNYATCFQIDNGRDGDNVFPFFLPLDVVKKDKPKEKKYRPFNKIKDFRDCGVIKGDCLIDTVLTFRDKKHYNLTMDIKVIDIEYDFDTVIRINGYSLAYFFAYFDIYIDGEWRPFGIEVEENEQS